MDLRTIELPILRSARPDARPSRALMAWVSNAGRGGAIWFGLAALMTLRSSMRRAAIQGAAGWGAGSAVAFLVKAVAQRRRPGLAGFGPAPTSSSMPSSHAAGAFAFAVAAGAARPPVAIVAVPLAATMAWSRLSTQRHFPTDVAAGIALGVAAGAGVHLVGSRIVRRTSLTSSRVEADDADRRGLLALSPASV